MPDQGKRPPTEAEQRARRQAKALRANLVRRKERSRQHETVAGDAAADTAQHQPEPRP
jgi:hypothetical protein